MAIYLFYSKTGTWLSRVLNVFVKEKYVHVSVSFDDKFDSMYTVGRVNYKNPFSGGYVVEDIRKGVYKHKVNSECLIYRVDVTKDQYFKLIESFNSLVNKKIKYNFLGLIAAYFNVSYIRKNYYFCSQLIGKILDENKVVNIDKPYEFLRPMDIKDYFKEKEIIYEGKIRDLSCHDSALMKAVNI